jgi:hypothetical protein
MVGENRAWTRQSEAFWRAHHETWKRSDLNQRQYCEAEGRPARGASAAVCTENLTWGCPSQRAKSLVHE